MKFKVFRTKTFDKEFDKLPKSEQKEIERFEKKLVENPFVGKPLGLVFFREKKIEWEKSLLPNLWGYCYCVGGGYKW